MDGSYSTLPCPTVYTCECEAGWVGDRCAAQAGMTALNVGWGTEELPRAGFIYLYALLHAATGAAALFSL